MKQQIGYVIDFLVKYFVIIIRGWCYIWNEIKHHRTEVIEACIVFASFIWLMACCCQISDHANIFSANYQAPYSWWNLIGNFT